MALSPNTADLSQKLQDTLGLPPGFRVWSPGAFGGMDQQSSRSGMKDEDFFVLENMIRIGPGKLRSMWDNGAPIYSAADPVNNPIVSFFFYNIGPVEYAAVFLKDGTADQVQVDTQAVTHISTMPGTFYNGGVLPACVQSGSQYLLIASNITPNSYWIWDGSVLYSAGSLGPVVNILSGGTGYSTSPSVTPFGGSGSGVSASSVVVNGSVVDIVITNPGTGYQPGEFVQFAFTAGGSDNSAVLQAVITAGTINHISLSSGGSGYPNGTRALSFTGGGGAGATGTYTVVGGHVTSVALTAPGAGYTGTPIIGFVGSGPGVGASAQAFLSAGSVTAVTIINGGSGFGVAPTLSFLGGGGSGATAHTTIIAGVIATVVVDTPGSNYQAAPAVVVQSGINSSASANATLMPFGVSGSSIETFGSRVWLPFPNQTGKQNNGGTFLVSAPGSLTDFATSDGGLIFVSSDRFLRAQYSAIRQANGFLYPFGDSSVSVISNVQTSGVPSTTTFNYQNTDPQIGTSWRDSLQDYSRTIIFANQLGVFGLYGGAVTKISDKIDDIFTNAFPVAESSAIPNALTPSSAVAHVFAKRLYLLLLSLLDPITKAARNIMIGWDEKEWYLVSQSTPLIYIGTAELNTDPDAWGTDGTSLFPLLETPSMTLTKRLVSKLYGAPEIYVQKTALAFYAQGYDKSAGQAGVVMTGTIDTDSASFAMPHVVTFPAPNPGGPGMAPVSVFAAGTGDIVGFTLGFSVTSTSPDFTIENLAMGYRHEDAVFG